MAFGLFKKKGKKENNVDQKGALFLTVKEVRQETSDAVSLVFEEPIQYLPGQFLTVIFTIDGKKVRRAYSLCSSPFTDNHAAVTVKRVENGLVSNYINDQVKAGDRIEIMEAMGSFTYNPDEVRKTTVLLAGGSGVTPMMSIAKSLLDQHAEANIEFVYANRNESSIIFKKTLEDLAAKYSNRMRLTHILSESENKDFTPYNVLPSAPFIKDLLKELGLEVDEETQYFTCGPAPMMDVITTALTDLGVSDKNFLKESFVSTTSEEVGLDGEEANVTILLDDEKYDFKVAGDKGILETALERDIDMPYSCQSGICTACRGKLKKGKVIMDGCDGLSQEEIDEGYVLTCVSKPDSAEIEIEIG